MERELGKDIPLEDRRQFLKDNCDRIEAKGYMKPFDADQISFMKDELATVDIQMNDIEEEKKEVMKDFKSRLDPLAEERKQLLKNIKEKAVFVMDDCYKFLDEKERMVGYYNGAGDLIESRPATLDELQKTTFSINRKTGTDD